MKIIADSSFDRLDKYISENLTDISRSYAAILISDGKITVNQKPANKKQKVNAGDVIDIFIPDGRDPDITPEEIELDIVFEDNDIIIVNKPQGMVVHPANGNWSGTLVNALMAHSGDSLSSINGVKRPGIVHRIDKNTSGLIMVAKNDKAHKSLAVQLKEHSIKREYIALVNGNIKEDRGEINAPIGRHKVDRKRMCVTDKNSKQAITFYEVLERYALYTLVKLTLKTGRTHQIRVHMAYIGHSVVGDDVYGARKDKFNLNGQLLHAKTIGFIHPLSGEYMEFSGVLPAHFEKIVKKLKK